MTLESPAKNMANIPIIIFASLMMLVVLLWSFRRVFRADSSAKSLTFLFFSVVFVSILLLRWPQITWNHEFNPDESQMVAQGMRFLSHPVPWRDVDGNTGGPLESQIFVLPLYFGAPASWALARTLLFVLNCLTLFFLYLALRCFAKPSEAQFALMPTVLFYAYASAEDFTHYSSETLPVAFFAIGIYLLARQWTSDKSSIWRWFVLGLICGALPFTKLQAGPFGMFLALAGFTQLIVKRFRGNPSQRSVWKEFVALCAGGLAVPVLILGVVTACGALGDFWNLYIASGTAYVGLESTKTKILNLCRVLFGLKDFGLYFLTVVWAPFIFLPVAWVARKTIVRSALFWPLLVTAAGCFLALFCIAIAGRLAYHYALLMIPAMTMLFGFVFLSGKAMLEQKDESSIKKSFAWSYWFAALCLPLAMLDLHRSVHLIHHYKSYSSYAPLTRMSVVSQRVVSVRRPGDTMAMWGWMPSYYLQSAMPPATRDNNTAYLIVDFPLQGYYRSNFLADLKRSPPNVFIDAIAGNTFQWDWTNAPTHEVYPELEQFLQNNYSLWSSVHMTNEHKVGTPIRIYLRKERMAELHLSPEEIYAPADYFYEPP